MASARPYGQTYKSLIIITLKFGTVANQEPMYQELQTNFETDQHPMSESLYNQLSQVRGFQETNGHTYEAYVKSWRERRGTSAPAPQPK